MKLKDIAYGPDCAHCNLMFNKLSATGYCPKNPAYRCMALEDEADNRENQLAIPAYLAALKNANPAGW